MYFLGGFVGLILALIVFNAVVFSINHKKTIATEALEYFDEQSVRFQYNTVYDAGKVSDTSSSFPGSARSHCESKAAEYGFVIREHKYSDQTSAVSQSLGEIGADAANSIASAVTSAPGQLANAARRGAINGLLGDGLGSIVNRSIESNKRK